jgi:hypothetical protein
MTEQELYERLIDTQQRLIVELQIQNRGIAGAVTDEEFLVWPNEPSQAW